MEVFNKLKKLERKFDEFVTTNLVVDETLIKCCVKKNHSTKILANVVVQVGHSMKLLANAITNLSFYEAFDELE